MSFLLLRWSCDHPKHLVVQPAVRYYDLAAKEVDRLAREIGHASSSLLDDQGACRDVPRVQLFFPETIEPARRDIAEIEGGGPEPPDRTRTAKESRKHLYLVVPPIANRLRKPGAEQRIDQRFGRRNVYRVSVEPRPSTPLCDKQLLPDGIEDDANLDPAFHFERQRHAKESQAVGKVRGAVEGINDPPASRRRLTDGAARLLLAQHGVSRRSLGDKLANRSLGGNVRRRDEIDWALFLDRRIVSEVFPVDAACGEGGFNSEGEVRGVDRQSVQLL